MCVSQSSVIIVRIKIANEFVRDSAIRARLYGGHCPMCVNLRAMLPPVVALTFARAVVTPTSPPEVIELVIDTPATREQRRAHT